MELTERFDEMESAGKSIAAQLRTLNQMCSELNGIAVTVPQDSPYPIVQFKGRRVILRNTYFDTDAREIKAVVSLPNTVHFLVSLNRKWFVKQ